MKISTTVALISAVFAAGAATSIAPATARDHHFEHRMGGCDVPMCKGDHERGHFRDFRGDNFGGNNFGGNDFGGNNLGVFDFGVAPYVPYYQPYYAPHYYQPYRVSHSCWRWSHKLHHRIWVCGRHDRHY
jgi:hypothetical protein